MNKFSDKFEQKAPFFNNIIAIALFVFATALYILTLAPTVSLWDCGEFISCAVRMEVGHPPGAPLFLLLSKLFSLLAINDTSMIAFWSNTLSAVASGATIALLYLISFHIIARTLGCSKLIAAIGAAIGALTFAGTDTFWFSAVESEVYALSIFFTALTLWVILKWAEEYSAKKYCTRWLVLACYLIGLSVCVHLLNILLIPILTLIVGHTVGYRGWKHALLAFGIGIAILAIVLFVFIQNGLEIAMMFELFMVNSCGLPIHSGLITFAILLFGSLFTALFITRKSNDIWHFTFVGLLMFFIGYSAYAMVIIRSNDNTNINLNSPSHVFAFDSFMNREQYGDKPLLYGPYYNSTPIDIKTRKTYRPNGDGKYESFDKILSYKYSPDECGFFPRLYSQQPHHIYGYSLWCDIDPKSDKMPSLIDNIAFTMRYQLGFMYVRYFLWNFAGRQNDIQGNGGTLYGNWICGIPIIDNLHLASESSIAPTEENNKACNKYFLLPLLFGIIGIVALCYKKGEGRHYLTMLCLLFVMTGPAIAFYLNQTPYEPRERDYAYVGSFFAFAIFIAIGVAAFTSWLGKKTKSKITKTLGVIASFLALPVLVLSENYDDHDRSNRYFDLNIAKAYLNSCEPNAILFTYGDNDTYPLWYAQEVELFRTDVSVINFGLLGADWCINQLTTRRGNASPIQLTIPLERYKEGKLDNAMMTNSSTEFASVTDVVNFIGSDNPASKLPLKSGNSIDYSPTSYLWNSTPNGDTLFWHIDKDVLYKNDIAFLDILSANRWKRPIYFTIGGDSEIFMGLDRYLRNDGMVLKLTSKATTDSTEYFDTDVLLNNFMNNMVMGDAQSYNADCFVRQTFNTIRYREIANTVAQKLIDEQRLAEAQTVLEKLMKELPFENCDVEQELFFSIYLLHSVGLRDVATNEATKLLARYMQEMSFYINNLQKNRDEMEMYIKDKIAIGNYAIQILQNTDNEKLVAMLEQFNNAIGLTDTQH